MMKQVGWAQVVIMLRGNASRWLDGVEGIDRIHLILGVTIFLVFPFTRLMHIWSAPVEYFTRRYQRGTRVTKPDRNPSRYQRPGSLRFLHHAFFCSRILRALPRLRRRVRRPFYQRREAKQRAPDAMICQRPDGNGRQ